jgi:MFS family permease
MSKTLKSILAVLAGFILVAVLSTVTDLILEKVGVFPDPKNGLFITWMLGLALVYRCLYTIAGGYLAAALAPEKPMKHGIILGLIGTAMACIGVVVGWDLSQHWYPISLVVTALPCTWLGAKLRSK